MAEGWEQAISLVIYKSSVRARRCRLPSNSAQPYPVQIDLLIILNK